MVKNCLRKTWLITASRKLETLGRTVKSYRDPSRDSISVCGLCFEVFEAKPDKATPVLW